MTTWAQDAADALDALGDSPTPDQARAVTDRYPNVDVLAALASRSGGGGGSGFASVTLGDEQIKALPTTAVTIVSGIPGKLILVLNGVMILDATGGAYTNVDAYSQLFLNYGAAGPLTATWVYKEAQGAMRDDSTVHLLGGFLGPTDASANASWFADVSAAVGADLTVFGWQGVLAGDFTGGGPANTLTVAVQYLTVDIP